MLISRLIAVGVLIAALKIGMVQSASAPVECIGRSACQVSAADEGNSGEGGAEPLLEGDGAGSLSPPDCWEEPLAEQPEAESAWWRGANASQGSVMRQVCREGSGVNPQVLVPYFVPFGQSAAAAAPPPPSPEVLAQQAIADLYIPMPRIGIGPDRTKTAVNLWTWLWVDEAPPVSVTVTAGGVSVTATATLTSTTWTLGEPPPTGGPYQAGPAVTISCEGVGTAPPANVDWKAEPPCGHKYSWMSTTERTGAGAWPIAVTTNWAVTWQSNTGAAGTDSLAGSAADALQVGEYRTVLVQGPGG